MEKPQKKRRMCLNELFSWKFQFSYYKFHYWKLLQIFMDPKTYYVYAQNIDFWYLHNRYRRIRKETESSIFKRAMFLMSTFKNEGEQKRQTTISLNFIWLFDLKLKLFLMPRKNENSFADVVDSDEIGLMGMFWRKKKIRKCC